MFLHDDLIILCCRVSEIDGTAAGADFACVVKNPIESVWTISATLIHLALCHLGNQSSFNGYSSSLAHFDHQLALDNNKTT